MKFQISHTLVDTLEDRKNLHMHVPLIKALLLKLLGMDTFREHDIPVIRQNLLVHECFSMVGIPKREDLSGELDLVEEIKTLFSDKRVYDPFIHTKFAINETSIEFQDMILAQEILAYQGKLYSKYKSIS